MKNNIGLSRVLEAFWLMVFIATLLLGIINSLKTGIAQNYMFFIISILSFVLFWARRTLRLKTQKNN